MATLSTVIGLVSMTDSYFSVDQDNSEPAYYGFQARDGTWYILRATTSGATVSRLYARGTSDYSTNWTNRATLAYSLPAVAFA